MQENSNATTVVADKATAKNNGKNNGKNKALDVQALLHMASVQQSTRTCNTCRLYADKLNFALHSGIDDGKRYACKVADYTMLLYADDNGNKASNKGDDAVVMATGKAKHNKQYLQAFNNGKNASGTCLDYDVQHITSNNIDYIIIDLLQYADDKQLALADKERKAMQEQAKNKAKNKAKNNAKNNKNA